MATAEPLSSHAGVRAEHLNKIDISLLSQSELQALSLCSSSAFDLSRTDDVVSPQLDRSVFNESAGSRRQTYSRLPHRSHSRLPRLHPSLTPHALPHHRSDPVNHSIVHFLKHFLNGNNSPPPPPPPPAPEPPKAAAGDVGFLGLQENLKLKRTRGRESGDLSKVTVLENGVGIEVQRINGRGEMVDLAELEEKGDEMYGEELRRRTAGLESEEAVLGFLRDLEGQWCSRRKKRKYVDSGIFLDVLPLGWKLLLGLRRRDHRVSVYCRRYISPTGQQFVSCKDAASFLKSYFGGNDADGPTDQNTSSTQKAYALSSDVIACPAVKTDNMLPGSVTYSTLAGNSSNSYENEDCFMGIENLPEVQVRDIFECFKCKLTFDEKNVYLQHLFSFHQKTTKRYKLGTTVGEGVIIKDGKYECQFCHKVFDERRSYNGHVGSHVRNSGKSSNEPAAPIDSPQNAESALQEGVPSRSSKLDALIEIAQNSISDNPNGGTGEQAIINHSSNVLRVEEAQEASNCHEEKATSDSVETQAEDLSADRTIREDINSGSQVKREENDFPEDDKACNVNIKMNPTSINDSQPAVSHESQKYENGSLEVDYGNRSLTREEHLQDTPGLTVEDIVFEGGTQSFQFFPPFDSVPNKGEHEFSVNEKLDNVTAFEELRFDDMEAFKYSFEDGQELSTLAGGSINMNSNGGIEDGFNSSVNFSAEDILMNGLHPSQLTVCVWCRAEFQLEGMESESLSDSIGYMCPTCKAKISGHFDGGFSMDSHNF